MKGFAPFAPLTRSQVLLPELMHLVGMLQASLTKRICVTHDFKSCTRIAVRAFRELRIPLTKRKITEKKLRTRPKQEKSAILCPVIGTVHMLK